MRPVRTRARWHLLALALTLLYTMGLGAMPVLALTGNVSAAATPSDATPKVGDQITVAVTIDMTGVSAPDNLLGSYTGTLTWDPTVLTYVSNSGAPIGFAGVVNTGSAASGSLTFNGANATGAAGVTVVLTVTYDVVAAGTTALDLNFSAMAAALTFVSVLPGIVVTDGQVVAAPAEGVTATATPDDAAPAVGDQIEVEVAIDMGGMEAPNNLLGSYSATLTWDPDILSYVSYSGAPPTGFTGVVNDVSVDTGSLVFNGANASGAAGKTVVITIVFDVVDAGVSPLDLSLSAMAAAGTYVNLLPSLTVIDGEVSATLAQYTLTVTKAGTGTGTVTSSPAGITCGSDCSELYDDGTSVTLTATAAAGSTFTGWSGSGCTGTGACSVTMDAAKSVEATFTLNSYTLSVTKAGTGTGTVTSSPAGITCGSDCSEVFNHGTAVTLTAAAATGSTFTGWSGSGCTGTSACTVTMDAAKSVEATFTLNSYTLSVTKAGTGSGTVTSSPAGISCGSDCSEVFNHGTSVTLT
ncbi:MAG: hypothetical protein GXY68_10195, partial [Chloroflexi bacterium]|nr:hypothetical protein [Chloroflexota bacterium]